MPLAKPMIDPKYPNMRKNVRTKGFPGSFHTSMEEAVLSQSGDAKHRSIWEVDGYFVVAGSLKQVMEAYMSGKGIRINRLYKSEIRNYLNKEHADRQRELEAEFAKDVLAQ